jgi:hypothetical protein
MTEVQQMLRKEERDRERWDFEQKEREKKMGAVWERIKKRRIETKLDLEVAFMIIQPHQPAVDARTRGVLFKILTAGAKWWDPVIRRRYEAKFKTNLVFYDVKVRHLLS